MDGVTVVERTSSAVPERPVNKKLRHNGTPAGDTQASRGKSTSVMFANCLRTSFYAPPSHVTQLEASFKPQE